MSKLVPTVSVTVVRDGKRITPPIGVAFAFTDAEVKAVKAQLPSAFRKPVNESGEPATDPVTTPEQRGDKTAVDDPQEGPKTPRRKAAQASATRTKALAADGGPRSTGAAQHDTTGSGTADEDDDI